MPYVENVPEEVYLVAAQLRAGPTTLHFCGSDPFARRKISICQRIGTPESSV
jgi:hypothetical protein